MSFKSTRVPEYSQLFEDINQPLSAKQISSIELTKTFRSKNSSLITSFEPGQLNFQIQQRLFNEKLQFHQSFTSNLQSITSASVHIGSLQSEAILEIENRPQQLNIIQQLQKQKEQPNFTANVRGNIKLNLNNMTATAMANYRGKILATSVLNRLGKILFGCEYVNILEKRIQKQMYAVGVGLDLDQTQFIVQVNSEKTLAAGGFIRTPFGNIGAKFQCKLQDINDIKDLSQLKWSCGIGLQKFFSRGQVVANINADGQANCNVRAVLGENVVAEVCVNGDMISGDIHAGVGIVF